MCFSKRKAPPAGPTASPRAAKRTKVNSARAILSQPPDKALNEKGELDVASFVKAREYEIKALESGMANAKRSLTTRAFQQVPRALRRRTASHNIKKVPKRLRSRAAKEIKDDNTPTGRARRKEPSSKQRLRADQARQSKGKSHATSGKEHADTAVSKVPSEGLVFEREEPAKPKLEVAKFRKRQLEKSWLPTHLFHAKRAHMTAPKSPLWRFAIPLYPTEKSYRMAHRAGRLRGCVAWDASYMATISLTGPEGDLLQCLRLLGLNETACSTSHGQRWLQGTRSGIAWLHEIDEPMHWITEALIIWQPSTEQDTDRQVWLHVHPLAFLQLWHHARQAAQAQSDKIKVADLRFELGAIDLSGPQSLEALVGVLTPSKGLDSASKSAETFLQLASATNANVLPQGALFSFLVSDPRLIQPRVPVSEEIMSESVRVLFKTLTDWPLDQASLPSPIFETSLRADVARLPSQKSIQRRKGQMTLGEKNSASSEDQDPRIPLLLLARNHRSASRSNVPQTSGSWTLIIPRSCVLAIWYSLMYHPLSTGGTPRFGGLHQQQQLCFEDSRPWFPGDYPGTAAGWAWELQERQRRKKKWESRPTSKRVAWNRVDLGRGRRGEIGRGWACDWELLHGIPECQDERGEQSAGQSAPQANFSKPPKVQYESGDARSSIDGSTAKKSLQATDGRQQQPQSSIPLPPLPIHQDVQRTSGRNRSSTITTVLVTLQHQGVVTSCARIYRLPIHDEASRQAWLAQATPEKAQKTDTYASFSSSEPTSRRAEGVSGDQVQPATDTDALHLVSTDKAQYPVVPDVDDLIGFITTGSYNLAAGRGTGIGSIILGKACERAPNELIAEKERPPLKAGDNRLEDEGEERQMQSNTARTMQGWCIVREAGQGLGRLARWKVV